MNLSFLTGLPMKLVWVDIMTVPSLGFGKWVNLLRKPSQLICKLPVGIWESAKAKFYLGLFNTLAMKQLLMILQLEKRQK